MYYRCIAVITVSALLLNDGIPATPKKADDIKNLQGTWQILSLQNGRSKGPSEEDLIKNKATLKITAEHLLFNTGGQDMPSKYKLDPSKKPKVIDVEVPGKDKEVNVSPGIYELNGDDLRICFPAFLRRRKENEKPTPIPLPTRPKEFKADEKGDDNLREITVLIICKRVKNP